ncbi:MAG: sensor histidine kinase [Chloroflexi bacterium]|nr:sensor histidine kinase [Chloroflexota bacterium]
MIAINFETGANCGMIGNMNDHPLEPGLLSIFRLFIVLRLILVLTTMTFYFAWSGSVFAVWQLVAILIFLADIPFLFLYLSWMWFQRKLGQFYLPVALLVATASPIVEMSYVFPLYNIDASLAFLLMFLLLLVPLILTAWQYRFRYVVIFSLATSVLEFSLLGSTPQFAMFGSKWAFVALFGRSVLSVFVGYIIAYLVSEQRKQRRALAQANQKLVRYASTLEQLATSRERNRLARELHDTLAHALSGLTVQLDAIVAMWEPSPPRAKAMLERALSIARVGLDETRRALQALRATPLEDMGLVWAIRSLAESMSARDSLTVELDLPEDLDGLPPEVEQCYYRVTQEALENASKHAQAHKVRVSLRGDEAGLVLEIADDGKGFDETSAALEERFGIRGMRERAELIGGTLEIDSDPGRGTTIRLCSGGCG